MNTDDRLVVSDLYLRRISVNFETGAKGRPVIVHHWTTNAANFLNVRQKEQRNLADEKKNYDIIEPASVAEYREFMGYKA